MAQEVDHKIPQWAGGSDDMSNLVSLCPECHFRKPNEDKQERARLRKAAEKEEKLMKHPGIKKPNISGRSGI